MNVKNDNMTAIYSNDFDRPVSEDRVFASNNVIIKNMLNRKTDKEVLEFQEILKKVES